MYLNPLPRHSEKSLGVSINQTVSQLMSCCLLPGPTHDLLMALHPLIVPLTLVPLSLVLVLLGPRPSVGDIEGDPYDLNNAPEWDNLYLNAYGESYDYDNLDQEVRVRVSSHEREIKLQRFLRIQYNGSTSKSIPDYFSLTIT